MNYILSILFLISYGCNATQDNDQVFVKKEFKMILEDYMDRFNKIPNDCDAKPFYKVHFKRTNDTIGFWVGTHLGEPSLVSPVEPGVKPSLNPIEIKGVCILDGKKIIFYDYIKSDGYGIYSPSKLKKYQSSLFDKLPEGCENVWYPEAWYFVVLKDGIKKTGKRDAYKLK